MEIESFLFKFENHTFDCKYLLIFNHVDLTVVSDIEEVKKKISTGVCHENYSKPLTRCFCRVKFVTQNSKNSIW